ncbi:hypothetical protein Mapa_009999 [Marchantia paleacea]|nr:hypothetical protein Mapa_009999 [Marchantia paleacea]
MGGKREGGRRNTSHWLEAEAGRRQSAVHRRTVDRTRERGGEAGDSKNRQSLIKGRSWCSKGKWERRNHPVDFKLRSDRQGKTRAGKGARWRNFSDRSLVPWCSVHRLPCNLSRFPSGPFLLQLSTKMQRRP